MLIGRLVLPPILEKNRRQSQQKGCVHVFFMKQKALQVPCFAAIYRNGSSVPMGNIHSNLSHNGVWELENYKDEPGSTFRAHNDLEEEISHQRKAPFCELNNCQAKLTRFEMRCGHLMGTTTNNVLRCLQFYLSEDLWDTVEDFSTPSGLKLKEKM